MTDAEMIKAKNAHQMVCVKNHDYKFHGLILTTFCKGNRQMRCVIEDKRGLLLIQSAKNLELY